MAGTCRFCGCTESTPCAGGCAWVDDTQTLCTVCSDAAQTARELVNVLGIVAAGEGSSIRIARPRFEQLPLEGQRTLVRICREMVDAVRAGIMSLFSEDAVGAMREIDRLSAFLLEHFDSQIGADDTAVDVALQLLEHVPPAPRIVLPGQVRP
jgi:hypothetical protein